MPRVPGGTNMPPPVKVLSRLLTAAVLASAMSLAPGCRRPCEADSDCDDRNACTQDVCTSGQCTNPALALDDQNPCTDDSCDPTQGIQRAAVNVDDGDACTLDWCQPAGGTQHARSYAGACFPIRLQFRALASIAEADKNILPAVEVEVQGPDGGVAVDSTASVSLTLNAAGQAAALAGTTTVAAVAGVARFDDVRVTAVANDVTLTAASAGLQDGMSNVFDVLAPCPAGTIRGGFGSCVDYCSTGTNPCTNPGPGTCPGGTAVNPISPGSCSVEVGPPYFSCVYSSVNTPCISPSDDCPTSTQRRHRTSTCVVAAGVAGCRVDTVLTDCATGGQVCYQGLCVAPPVVNSATPTVAAHGAQVVLAGSGFTSASSVTVGGIAQTFTINSANQITIAALSDTVPVGAQSVVVTNVGTTSAPVSVTVVHLVVNEIDTRQLSTDTAEFIEVSTGAQGNVSLAGYALVLFAGGTHTAYLAVDLTTSDASGFWIAGNASLATGPESTFGNDSVSDGYAAAAIYQGTAAQFSLGTTLATATGLIDAVVYTGAVADGAPTLVSTLLLGGGAQVAVTEATNGQSIQRCSPGVNANATNRRDGRAFSCVLAPPTPRAANPQN